MDGFGDFLGGLFEGAGEAAEWFGIEGPGGEAERPAPDEGDVPPTYERYLAGGPRDLNINDL